MRVINGEVIEESIPELTADGRAQAESRSLGCQYCGGKAGMCLVDATNPDARVQTCAATCVCLHGRWVRAWHDSKGRGDQLRIPDLAAIQAGRDRRWRYNRHGYEPDADAEPAPAPTREQIAGMFRRPS